MSASRDIYFLIKIERFVDHIFISMEQILVKNQVAKLHFCLNEKFGKL